MPKTNQRYFLTKFNWQLDDSYLSITLLQIKKEKKKKSRSFLRSYCAISRDEFDERP